MFKVNVLEVNRQDEVTENVLISYDIQANHKLKAITEAGKQFKQNELYQVFKHNYFLKAIEV